MLFAIVDIVTMVLGVMLFIMGRDSGEERMAAIGAVLFAVSAAIAAFH